MRLLATYAVCALLAVGAVGALNWWVDPLGDVYDGAATAEAIRTGCSLSDDVVGVNSWWEFKRDLAARRRPTTIVVGTSRTIRLTARPGQRDFANESAPGTSAPMLADFFRDLHERRPGALTVLLGVEVFWLNENWTPPYSYRTSTEVRVRDFLTRQRLSRTVALLWREPALLFRRWSRGSVGGTCVLDRAGRAARGEVSLWGPDGSLQAPWELDPGLQKPVPADDFGRDLGSELDNPNAYLGGYYTKWRRLGHLGELERALGLARSYRWRVVGFTAPYSARYVERLQTAPATARRWREFGETMPRLFARYEYRYVDTRDVRRVGCAEPAFVDDGWHPTVACSTRVRALLESR